MRDRNFLRRSPLPTPMLSFRGALFATRNLLLIDGDSSRSSPLRREVAFLNLHNFLQFLQRTDANDVTCWFCFEHHFFFCKRINSFVCFRSWFMKNIALHHARKRENARQRLFSSELREFFQGHQPYRQLVFYLRPVNCEIVLKI